MLPYHGVAFASQSVAIATLRRWYLPRPARSAPPWSGPAELKESDLNLLEFNVRTCPFNNCGATIPSDLFACRKHWYSLNKSERETIWAAYRDFLASRIDGETLRRVQQEVLGERGVA